MIMFIDRICLVQYSNIFIIYLARRVFKVNYCSLIDTLPLTKPVMLHWVDALVCCSRYCPLNEDSARYTRSVKSML